MAENVIPEGDPMPQGFFTNALEADGPEIPVPPIVWTKTKAVIATVTSGVTVLGMFGTMISDGHLTWGEGGTLIGALTGAIATVVGVWAAPNMIKNQ